MTTTKYTVEVNETGEVQEFDSLVDARAWAEKCRKTLDAWGGTTTFTCTKTTTEKVSL